MINKRIVLYLSICVALLAWTTTQCSKSEVIFVAISIMAVVILIIGIVGREKDEWNIERWV